MMDSLAYKGLQIVSPNLASNYQFRSYKLHKFKPKVDVSTEVGPFLLKTVNNQDELRQALELRFQVFHKEMTGSPVEKGLDIDEYDKDCDHLIILDKKTEQVIGTYRLNCSLFSDRFYSEREFEIAPLLKTDGIKTELGRACIHKDYRRGIVISLLWRGIAEYMVATHSQTLLGCASVNTKNPREAALIHRYLIEENRIHPDFQCPPTQEYQMPHFNLWSGFFKAQLTEAEKKEVLGLIPPLFRAYLKIGAYVGGAPAWDEEFQCIDFLTILHKEDLNRSLWKKYKMDSGYSID